MALQLYIGHKNYSSWSMPPWVLMRHMGIEFQEINATADTDANSIVKHQPSETNPLEKASLSVKVPVLVEEGFVVWDTLAIVEYLAERFPEHNVWPTDRLARARARSICAEVHRSFSALRHHCLMDIEANLLKIGQLVWRDQAQVRADVARLSTIWSQLLAAQSPLADGSQPFLFGEFCAADAYFAPACMRIHTYQLPLSDELLAYVQRVRDYPAVQAWMQEAKREHALLDFEEPYRLKPETV
jgi:glutathione S-transferase